MTLKITSIQSAKYVENNQIEFTVTCGNIADVVTKIFNTTRDRENDVILQTWINEGNAVSAYVAPDDPDPVSFSDLRRKERQEEFSWTIDKLNPMYYNSLTSEQQAELTTWRQAWLDYPNDENNTKPNLPEGIF
jgi:hypothetical protein